MWCDITIKVKHLMCPNKYVTSWLTFIVLYNIRNMKCQDKHSFLRETSDVLSPSLTHNKFHKDHQLKSATHQKTPTHNNEGTRRKNKSVFIKSLGNRMPNICMHFVMMEILKKITWSQDVTTEKCWDVIFWKYHRSCFF